MNKPAICSSKCPVVHRLLSADAAATRTPVLRMIQSRLVASLTHTLGEHAYAISLGIELHEYKCQPTISDKSLFFAVLCFLVTENHVEVDILLMSS